MVFLVMGKHTLDNVFLQRVCVRVCVDFHHLSLTLCDG